MIEKDKAAGLVEEAAVYFRSLSDGLWFGIDERKEFSPASILKIPVMLTYFKMAEDNPGILNEKFKYEPQDTGGFVPGVKQNSTAEIGKYYSIDELIGFLIAESDNNADVILLRNLPPDALNNTFRDFGIDVSNIPPEGDFVSLKICAGFLRVLYNASYINEALSEKALEYLAKSTYRDGIVAGLPQDIAVAHKFGERFSSQTGKRQLHEMAIVYYPKNPYVLAIMTKGNDYSSLSKVIRDISELIYKEIDAQYKTSKRNFFLLSE
ncbi:MAG: class A beta-lactamase-related serine hydrolase [Candidatus Omnitrophica bacterium]|nr:class A beta-lactamase-related serine hydrolase [Candidatus Omnitrophota bacterium]